METVYLDTHVVVWLFAGEVHKLSPRAIERIETGDLLISPMVLLELEYLREIGRITYPHETIIGSLSKSIDLNVCDLLFVDVTREAIRHTWTRDPFDRMIVAQAALQKSSILLSRDRNIRQHYLRAEW